MPSSPSPLLLSVDFEDSRYECIDKLMDLPRRVDIMGRKLLEFFELHNVRATFFTVGKVALENKSVLNDIVSQGHELGCHGFDHKTLNTMNRDEFRRDLRDNLDALSQFTNRIYGYRSPCYSLGKEQSWAWEELNSAGLKYSSSILPANGLYFGWKEFGMAPRRVIEDFWEIPISVSQSPMFSYPFAGGLYLRLLPKYFIKRFAKRLAEENLPIVSYLHPYDIDSDEQEFPMNPNKFYNKFLFIGRGSSLKKISALLQMYPSMTYFDYRKSLNMGSSS